MSDALINNLDSNYAYTLDDSMMFKMPPMQPTIQIQGLDGRSAKITVDDEGVTYGGDLPVTEAAQIFFEAVFEVRKRVQIHVAE